MTDVSPPADAPSRGSPALLHFSLLSSARLCHVTKRMNLKSRLFTVVFAMLASASVAFSQTAKTSDAPAKDAAATTAASQEVAIISTTMGDMTIAFWPEVAPKTVANFKKLAREGFYDGTAFHRIIKGFMIQGGCPNSKKDAPGIPGTGDPGYKIKAEFNSRSHVRGVISMARSSDPNSAGSQFFICHGNAKFLDRQYTAFGQLIAGDDVLDKIADAPTVPGGRENSTPRDRIEVKSIKIVEKK